MNILEKYDSYFVYIGVVANLFIAGRFYMLWAHPQPEQVSLIITMATLMGFEFIMVHSGVFMSVFPKKISLFIFFPFYGIFALVFALMIDDWEVVIFTYLFAVLNRMRFAFADVSTKIKTRNVTTSIIAVVVYFILMFVVAFGSDGIPEWGLTEEFLTSSGYYDTIRTGGLLIDVPQTAMCLGVTYYIVLAVIEFLLINAKGNGNKEDGLVKSVNS